MKYSKNCRRKLFFFLRVEENSWGCCREQECPTIKRLEAGKQSVAGGDGNDNEHFRAASEVELPHRNQHKSPMFS